MATKVTFTLDDDTVRTIRRMAERGKKPQSLVVREAVALYAARDIRISVEERDEKLRIIREMTSRPPTRTADEADKELRELRRSRRGPHRLHPVD